MSCGGCQTAGCHRRIGAPCPAIYDCPRAGQPKCFGTLDAPAVASSTSATIGKVVWLSDIADIKARIDPPMRATDETVRSCDSVSAADRVAWMQFYDTWRGFHDAPSPWLFGWGNVYDEAELFQARLGGWQEFFRGKGCAISGPAVSPDDPGAAGLSALKWAAAAAIVVAGVVGLRTVLK